MIKDVVFLRPLNYNYKIGDHDIYDSFDLVARRNVNPSIIPIDKATALSTAPDLLKQADVVYCSRAIRSQETAAFFSDTPITLPVHEIEYSMSDFIPKEDFYLPDGSPDVNKARRLFFQAFTEDRLQESFQSVIDRIKYTLQVIKEVDSEFVAVITHGFLLAVIEAYIRDPSIEEDPKKLLDYYDGSTITFHFFEGFSAKIDNEGEFGNIKRVERRGTI